MSYKTPPSPLRPVLSVAVAVLGFALAGSTVFAQSAEQQEVESHLPAGKVSSDPGEGETLATNQEIAEAVRQAIQHAHPQFTPQGLAGAGVSLRQGAAHLIAQEAVKQAPGASTQAIVEAVFTNSNLSTANDKPATVGAIVAGAICGAKAANGSLSVLKGAVKTIVTQAILSTRVPGSSNTTLSVGNTASGDFRVNLDPSAAMEKLDMQDGISDNKGLSKASAGAVTGAVSQLTGFSNNGADKTLEANKYVKVIVKTAVKNASKEYLEIAQAAANAAAAVYNLTANGGTGASEGYTPKTIIAAVTSGLIAAKKTVTAGKKSKIKIAVKFGIAQANAGQNGAGAAGVANYAFNNCNNNAVTDISGF